MGLADRINAYTNKDMVGGMYPPIRESYSQGNYSEIPNQGRQKAFLEHEQLNNERYNQIHRQQKAQNVFEAMRADAFDEGANTLPNGNPTFNSWKSSRYNESESRVVEGMDPDWKFDPFTGESLEPQWKFDPFTGKPLNEGEQRRARQRSAIGAVALSQPNTAQGREAKRNLKVLNARSQYAGDYKTSDEKRKLRGESVSDQLSSLFECGVPQKRTDTHNKVLMKMQKDPNKDLNRKVIGRPLSAVR